MTDGLIVREFDQIFPELEEAFEHFKMVFCESLEDLMSALDEITEILDEVFILSPKEYGISRIRTKIKEKSYDTYRCLQKVLKNMPYHRRDYRVLVPKREEFDTCEDEE